MDNYNLLDEKWISVFREDGTRDWIAPHQVAEPENRPVAFAGRLPDFNSAYTQFMVGLLQTAMPPEDLDDHADFYEDGPSPTVLKNAFAPFRDAFYLVHEDEDHPRFFQTPLHRAPQEKREGWVKGVDYLIHQDGSTTSTSDHNPLPHLDYLDLREAAAALISMQVDGSGNSGGFFTSLRGGGPVTASLKCEQSLWKTLWLNVIPSEEMDKIHRRTPNKDARSKVFSWMHEDLIASWENDEDHVVKPKNANPNFVFWSVSKNIRLILDEGQAGGVRHIYNTASSRFVPKDGEGWRHPMTPYLPSKGDKPVRASKADVNFDVRDWVVARYGLGEDKQLKHLPRTFELFLANDELQDIVDERGDIIRLHLTGPDYEDNQAKVLGYLDRTFPLLSVDTQTEYELRKAAGRLIFAYDEMVSKTRKKVWKVFRDVPNQSPFECRLGVWFKHEPDVIEALYRWQTSGLLQQDDGILRELLKSFQKSFLSEYKRITGLKADARGRRIKVEGTEISLVVDYDRLRRSLSKTVEHALK